VPLGDVREGVLREREEGRQGGAEERPEPGSRRRRLAQADDGGAMHLFDPCDVEQPRRANLHLVLGPGHADELAVEPQVAAQLRMEAQRHDAALPHRDRMMVVAGDHLYVASSLDEWGADEHPWKRLAVKAVDVELSLKAVDLAAVAVAPHADVEQAEAALAAHSVCDVAREHDHAGACGERSEAALDGVAQRLE